MKTKSMTMLKPINSQYISGYPFFVHLMPYLLLLLIVLPIFCHMMEKKRSDWHMKANKDTLLVMGKCFRCTGGSMGIAQTAGIFFIKAKGSVESPKLRTRQEESPHLPCPSAPSKGFNMDFMVYCATIV